MSGLYLHIPFCAAKCRYCDFPSYAGMEHRIGDYLDAMIAEMRALSGETWDVFDTVFIGGGTPSLLSGEQLRAMMDALRRYFKLSSDAEISMECNPGTVDVHKLSQYHEAGVNRVSFGLQSMDTGLLKRIGRIHTPETFLQSFHDAREAGFININVDIMSGLPGQTLFDYLDTLRRVADLDPEHISAYGLILEEGTPLISDVQKGIEAVPDEDAVSDMLDAGMGMLNERGYERYEISNFARQEYACRHNLNYWSNGEYLGIGAAAHSAWRLYETGKSAWTRWNNPAELDAYIETAGIPLAARKLVRIATNEEAFETIMLGLRTVQGVSLAAFFERFSCSLEQFFPSAVKTLSANGWLQIMDGYARLSPRGLDMQNAALQYFLEESEKAPD